MNDVLNVVQMVLAAIGGYIGWIIGGADSLMYALIAFVVIDYLTGVMVAIINRKLCSAIGFKGIFKKVLIFSFVGIGHIIDFYIIEKGSAVRTAVIFFYLSNEGISIIENAGRVGLPIPEKLKSVLTNMNQDGGA